MRVVLPAPFSPSNPWMVPGSTVREMPSLARTVPKYFLIPLSSTFIASLANTKGGVKRRTVTSPLPQSEDLYSLGPSMPSRSCFRYQICSSVATWPSAR